MSRVCRSNTPLRFTRAEREAQTEQQASDTPPTQQPLGSWLAVPLIGREGQNLGLIQLARDGEEPFREADEAILLQLAQVASVVLFMFAGMAYTFCPAPSWKPPPSMM